MGHRTCSSTMLFVVSYGIYPIFIQNILVFLIMAPPQQLAFAPGATITDNTVYQGHINTNMKFLCSVLWSGGLCTDAEVNYTRRTNHDYIASFQPNKSQLTLFFSWPLTLKHLVSIDLIYRLYF